MNKVTEDKAEDKKPSKGSDSKKRSKKNQRATYKQALVNGVHLRNKLRRVRRHILRMGEAGVDAMELEFGTWADQLAVKAFLKLGGKLEQLRRRVDTKG